MLLNLFEKLATERVGTGILNLPQPANFISSQHQPEGNVASDLGTSSPKMQLLIICVVANYATWHGES